MHEFTRTLEPRHYAISSLNSRRAGSGSNGIFNLGCFVDQFAAEANWIADQLAGSREEFLRGNQGRALSRLGGAFIEVMPWKKARTYFVRAAVGITTAVAAQNFFGSCA